MATKKIPGEEMVGALIGFYKLNKEFVHHNSSFETASWWEDTKIEPGIYPIKVIKSNYDFRNPIGLSIQFKGKVVDAYFPSSFAGNIVPGSGKSPDRIGAPRDIGQGLDWKKAVSAYGASPSRDEEPDIWIDPKFWPNIDKMFEERIEEHLELLDYARKAPTRGENREEDRAGALQHAAQRLAKSAEDRVTILREMQYQVKGTHHDLHVKNTKWATGPKKAPENRLQRRNPPTQAWTWATSP